MNTFYLFVDESYDKNCFILLGCIVNGKELFDLEKSLKDVTKEYKINNLKEDLRKKLSKNVKLDVTKKLTNLMEKYNVQVISCILSYRNIKILEKNDGLKFRPNQLNKDYEESLSFLLERFYKFLIKNHGNGIIIFDQFTINRELKNSIKNFLEGRKILVNCLPATKRCYYEVIYPSIFFTDDEYSLILQLSDLILLSLHKSYEKCLNEKNQVTKNDIEELWKYNEFLKEYFKFFQKSENGKVSGWGIKLW
jgi:hypothetical protein